MNSTFCMSFAFYMWAIGKAMEEVAFKQAFSEPDAYFEQHHPIIDEEENDLEQNHWIQVALLESFMEDEPLEEDSISVEEIALIKKWDCKRPDNTSRRSRYNHYDKYRRQKDSCSYLCQDELRFKRANRHRTPINVDTTDFSYRVYASNPRSYYKEQHVKLFVNLQDNKIEVANIHGTSHYFQMELVF